MIQLQKRTFYAIEATLYIAYNGSGGCISSKEIAQKQKMLPRYLEQIMQKLVKAEILKGVRGPAGGYLLAREKRRITIADICEAMEEEEESVIHSTPFGDKVIWPMLHTLQDHFMKSLKDITIHDLCKQATDKNIRKNTKDAHNFTI